LETVEKPASPWCCQKKLLLKLDGRVVAEGTWDKLIRMAIKHSYERWEIVEKVEGFGERLVTTHRPLNHSGVSI
jgi:hypothetical protein